MSSFINRQIALSKAASAAPMSSSLDESKDGDWLSLNTAPPTKEQLSALSAVPAAMVKRASPALRASSGSKTKKKKGASRGMPMGSTSRSVMNAFVSRMVGNDSSPPWIRRPPLRAEIEINSNSLIAVLATVNTVTPQFAGVVFTISGITDFSSYAAIFDEYCIKQIEVLITPTITEVTDGGAVAGSMYSAIDIDDGNTPTALTDLGNYTSVLESRATVSHYHRWAPQYAVATFSGAFTSYSAQTGWVDCASPSVQYYGLKFGVSAATSAQPIYYQYRMKIGFRGMH